MVDLTGAVEAAGVDSVVAVSAWLANKSLLGCWDAVPVDEKKGSELLCVLVVAAGTGSDHWRKIKFTIEII